MVPRPFVAVLVYALAVLIVSFGVLMGGYVLLSAAEDTAFAVILGRVGGACLMLVIIDVVLLVGALGVNALAAGGERSADSS